MYSRKISNWIGGEWKWVDVYDLVGEYEMNQWMRDKVLCEMIEWFVWLSDKKMWMWKSEYLNEWVSEMSEMC